MVIDSFNKDSDIGVPLGNQTNQCFALYYLENYVLLRAQCRREH